MPSNTCDLKPEPEKPSGRIWTGVPESTILYRFSPVLIQYKELYPEVKRIMVNAICREMKAALKNGELDIAILLEQQRRDQVQLTQQDPML